MTFTRNSAGTYRDAIGVLRTAAVNEPRFDHDPSTGESLGLLVEEQRTNLIILSEDFTISPWATFGSASRTANTTIAPNGTLTADSVTFPASSGIFLSASASASTTYTFSIWVRCDTTQSLRILVNTNLNDPATKTITATPLWQRFDVTKTTATGTTVCTAQIDTGGGNTYNLWGAQLEVGAFPTSYIPTTGSAATRGADVASISGSNFSSWYRQDEGTVFCDGGTTGLSANNYPTFAGISDEGFSNYSQFSFQTSSTGGFIVVSGGSTSVEVYPPILTSRRKCAFALKANDFAVSFNGSNPSTDTSGAMPLSVNQLRIGTLPSSNIHYLNGTISRFVYWPQRLPNPTLQALSL